MALVVAGQATDEEVHSLSDHLEGCAGCRGEMQTLGEVGLILDQVDPGEVTVLLDETPVPPGRAPRGDHRRRRTAPPALIGAAAVALAAVLILAVLPGSPPGGPHPTAPAATVALGGQDGVTASVALLPQDGGTRALLRIKGEPVGRLLTVSMESRTGGWWVAGSFRSDSAQKAQEVGLSCAVPPDQVLRVWITDPKGRVVLDGSVT